MRKALLICLLALAFSANVDVEKIRNELLDNHNYIRAQHHADKLVRDSELELMAQKHTDYLANTFKQLKNSEDKFNGEYVGQNLYKCTGCDGSSLSKDAINFWYTEEEPVYDYKNPGFSQTTGHFCQVVWRNTKKLGCGITCLSSEKSCYLDCYYFPAGNYESQYKDNVLSKSDSDRPKEEPKPDEKEKDEVVLDPKEYEESLRKQALDRHNYYRNKHQVGNLVRDSKLEEIAKRSTNKMVELNQWYFTEEKYNNQQIQQNLISFNKGASGEDIVDRWYEGSLQYDFKNPGWNSESAGFTQMVWKSTQKIGCAASCFEDKDFCFGLCVYYPAGNYEGEFEENVFPSL